MVWRHLILLAIVHAVLAGIQRESAVYMKDTTKKTDEKDKTLDEDALKETRVTMNIIDKIRTIFAAVENMDTSDSNVEATVTERPKSHEDLFMELIDHMERPLEEENSDLFIPSDGFDSGDYDGNIDYTEYALEDYFNPGHLYEDYHHYDEYFNYIDYDNDVLKVSAKEKENSTSKHPQETKHLSEIVPKRKIQQAFPELLHDIIPFNEIPEEVLTKKRKAFEEHKEKKSKRGKHVRVKKKARLEDEKNIDKEKTDTAEREDMTNLVDSVLKENRTLPDDISVREEDIDQDLLAVTISGKVLGRQLDISNGVKVKEYLSIPYAQPPIGALRFKSPKQTLEWDNVLNATIQHPHCWNSFAANSWEVSMQTKCSWFLTNFCRHQILVCQKTAFTCLYGLLQINLRNLEQFWSGYLLAEKKALMELS